MLETKSQLENALPVSVADRGQRLSLQDPRARSWDRLWIPVFFALATLVQGLIYLAVIPPWQGPDEPRHYEYVRLLHDKGRLVSWDDITPSVEQDIILSLDQHNYWKWGATEYRGQRPQPLPADFGPIWGEGAHELHQPPLSYLLYLAPLSIFAQSDLVVQLVAMRLVSILLNVVIVLAAYATGRELFPNDASVGLGLPIFVLLLPQHTFQLATVNSDHLAEAAIAWMFPFAVRTLRDGISVSRVLVLAALVLSGLAAKRIAFVGVPILFFTVLIRFAPRWRREPWPLRRLATWASVGVIAISLSFIAGIGGWGWLEAHSPRTATWFLNIFLFLPSEQFPFTLDARIISPAAFYLYASYLKTIFISTWGHFGWMNISLGVKASWFFAALCLFALVGLGRLAWRALHVSTISWGQRAALLLFGLSVVAALALVIANEVRRWDLRWGGAPQGRYLFPVLIPLATLFLLGTREFIPERLHTLWFGVVVAGMVMFNVVALVGFIIPFYT